MADKKGQTKSENLVKLRNRNYLYDARSEEILERMLKNNKVC